MTFKLELNRSAVKELLRSEALRADVAARAERIAAQAGDGFVADSGVGKNRAHASVVATTFEARKAEADAQDLTRAIDAGR